MKKLILVLAIIFVSCGNANANTEIDDVCKWAETKVVKSMIDANIYKGYYEGTVNLDDADSQLKKQKENEKLKFDKQYTLPSYDS